MSERLSHTIGEAVAYLERHRELHPVAIESLIALNRRLLPVLLTFTVDYEFAECQRTTAGAATHLAANAAARLYRKLAFGTPSTALQSQFDGPSTLPGFDASTVIDLDRFRSPHFKD